KCRVRSHVPKTLHHDASAAHGFTNFFKSFFRHINNTKTGCSRASERSTDFNWLSSDNAIDGEALLLRVSIHHPRHGLRISADIRSWNIFVRANEWTDFRSITTSE